MIFYDFFHDLHQLCMTFLCLAVAFEKFQNNPLQTAKRRYFFYITQFNKQRICLMTCLCHIFLALTSSVINLTNTALIFDDFPGLENEIRKFPDFQGFLRPVHPWFHEPARVIRHGLKVVVFFFFFFFKQQLEQGYISVCPLFSGSFFPACLTILDHTLSFALINFWLFSRYVRVRTRVQV